MEIIKELFTTSEEKFIKHLSYENNNRIIFSGRFGKGKTTFLKYYFENSEQESNYNLFHLFPVNYSVLKNEDIFRYLKYDILYELMIKYGGEITFRKEDFDYIKELSPFVALNLDKLCALLLLLIPKMGRQLHQLSKEIEEINRSFQNIKNSIKNELGDVESYMSNFYVEEGEMYEFNIITKLIIDKLQELSEGSDRKENILILDDLDRVDPEHLFRLLNVFSAHFDTRDDGHNKFGFDKIILVFDIENVRSIFHYKYGGGVDFGGYIDKFYSVNIFNYNNVADIEKYLELIVDSFKLVSYYENETKELNKPNGIKTNIVSIFLELVLSNQINLRNVLRFKDSEIRIYRISLSVNNKSFADWEYYFAIVAKILFIIYGSYEEMHKGLSGCSKKLIVEPNFYEPSIAEVIAVMKFNQEKDYRKKYSYSLKNNDVRIEYEALLDNSHNFYFKIKGIKNSKTGGDLLGYNRPSYAVLFLEGIEKLKEYGYFDKL